MTVAKVLLALLAVWVLIAVVGILIKGLFWLFVLGCIAFGFTLAGSAGRRRISGRR
jgi:hypothetical protein